MRLVVEYDLTSDRTSTVPGTNHQERACFRVQVGDSWSSPLTPSELQAVCAAQFDTAQHKPLQIDPATAIITSSFFNFSKSEARRAGSAATAKPVTQSGGEGQANPFETSPSGVVKRYHPSLEDLKKMGYKSLNHYLRKKGIIAGEATKETSLERQARKDAALAMDLDLSDILGDI